MMRRSMNLVLSEKKQELVEKLLGQGMILVALDGRADGVDLPAHLRSDPQVRLNLSHRFGLPMETGPWGIHATLHFGGVPYDCKLPWGAIFLVFCHGSKEQYLFPLDLPDDLLGAVEAEGEEDPEAEAAPAQEAPAPAPARPRFSVVQGGAPAPPADDEPAGDEQGPARPAYLRRIK